jgi:hypothetical protein
MFGRRFRAPGRPSLCLCMKARRWAIARCSRACRRHGLKSQGAASTGCCGLPRMLWLWLAIILGAGVTFLQEPLWGDSLDAHMPHATPVHMRHRVCGVAIAVGPNAVVDAGLAATVWAPLPVFVGCASPATCGAAGSQDGGVSVSGRGGTLFNVNGSSLSAAQLLLAPGEERTEDVGRVVWVPGGVAAPAAGAWPGASLATVARHAAALGFACDYYLVLPLGATWDLDDKGTSPAGKGRAGAGSRAGPR